jgi:hypothetical protein
MGFSTIKLSGNICTPIWTVLICAPIMVTLFYFFPFSLFFISFLSANCLRNEILLAGGSKPATLDTGAVVNVPLFVNIGDEILVDSRTGQYMSRA